MFVGISGKENKKTKTLNITLCIQVHRIWVQCVVYYADFQAKIVISVILGDTFSKRI